MATIKLDKPWTYRDGVSLSIDYPAGEFEVADEIAAAAASQGGEWIGESVKPTKAKAAK